MVGFDHRHMPSWKIQVIIQINFNIFFDSLSKFRMEWRDIIAISHSFLQKFLLSFLYLLINNIQSIPCHNLSQLILRYFLTTSFHSLMLHCWKMFQVRNSQALSIYSLLFHLFQMLYKCTVDHQSSNFVFQRFLLHVCEVQPEYLHQLYLTFRVEFFHQFHDQILELSNHIAPHFLLPLEYLNKIIKIFVKTNRKTILLIDFPVLAVPLAD